MEEKKVKNIFIQFLKLMTYFLALIWLTCRMTNGKAFGNFEGLFVHSLIYLSIFSLLLLATKKNRISFCILNLIEYIFSVICYLKVETRCQLLEPWDFVFSKNLVEFANFVSIDFKDCMIIIGELILTFGITFLEYRVFEAFCEIPKQKIKKMFLIFISCVSLVFLTTKYMKLKMIYIDHESAENKNYSNYNKRIQYGAFSSFIMDLGIMDVAKESMPENYSKEYINSLKNIYENDTISGDKKEYDNVIMVLMESFYDVTELEQFKSIKDPLSNFHKYQGKYASSFLDASNIGGGTANTEYKALTMYSDYQYLDGIYPYMHCIMHDVDTLPRIFKNNGYTTTGIHSYNKGFYNRDRAYPLMGIDRFISDEDFENPELYGNFISDNELYNKIVEIVENEEKSFITVSTMGTHTPYDNLIYETYDEWIEYDGLTYTKKLKVNNYIQSLRKLDEMLGKLIKYVENSDENTLIIFYGDHFPMMYAEAKALGLIKGNTISKDDSPKLFETPYMVVSNVEDANIKSIGKIDASKLGMYILENVKLDLIPWQYNVIYKFLKTGTNEEEYLNVQYDEIFGER